MEAVRAEGYGCSATNYSLMMMTLGSMLLFFYDLSNCALLVATKSLQRCFAVRLLAGVSWKGLRCPNPLSLNYERFCEAEPPSSNIW